MKIDRRFRGPLYLLLLFIIWTVLAKIVDSAPIGPNDTVVGFSTANGIVHDHFGMNNLLYGASSFLGILAVGLDGVFVLIGILQIVTRRSLMKADRKLIAAGFIYVFMMLVYMLFRVCVISYSPVIMPGSTAPDVSYPSSHVMLGCVSFGIGALLLNDYVKSRGFSGLLRFICSVLTIAVLVISFFSGVCWFTDIIGGLIISMFFLALYYALYTKIDYLDRKHKK